ncbi:MAG TPA: hypothetical protein PK282_04795 [Rhodoglobus sp.]|nr:hypothetical protein [Rhodoglobus sp.]HPM51534.1 hypothetical protein [Rhodoglobus sp.]
MSVTFDTALTGGGTASGIVVPEEIMAQLGPASATRLSSPSGTTATAAA